jgi:hypothetical protein
MGVGVTGISVGGRTTVVAVGVTLPGRAQAMIIKTIVVNPIHNLLLRGRIGYLLEFLCIG